MSSTGQWTKEPWEVQDPAKPTNQVLIYSKHANDAFPFDHLVASCSPSHSTTETAIADGHRIVTCVNACAGIEKPGEVIPRLVEALEKIASCDSVVEGDVVDIARQALSLVRKQP